MDYAWIKAVHVAAVLVFTGGLFVQTLVLLAIHRQPAIVNQGVVAAVMTWDRRVSSPALLVVWAMGIWAASFAGWIAAPWLWIKLSIVLALSALHGMQSGALRRVAAGGEIAPADHQRRPLALVFAFALIAVLAVVKPFQ